MLFPRLRASTLCSASSTVSAWSGIRFLSGMQIRIIRQLLNRDRPTLAVAVRGHVGLPIHRAGSDEEGKVARVAAIIPHMLPFDVELVRPLREKLDQHRAVIGRTAVR